MESSEFKALRQHYEQVMKHFDLRQAFKTNPNRHAEFSARLGDHLLFDYSKNLLDQETRRLLLQLAQAAQVPAKLQAMFNGQVMNPTEGRAVLHMALRGSCVGVRAQGQGGDPNLPVDQLVGEQLTKLERIAMAIRQGEWVSATGQPFTTLVNIGIGGSDLGPAMVYEALRLGQEPKLRVHFVSNVDGAQLASVLHQIDPERTLFCVVSKTFTTAETMANANLAKAYLLEKLAGHAQVVERHFVAVSANAQAMAAFGIDPVERSVLFWDWVGGRFSVWSGVGLCLAIAFGPEQFSQLLAGAKLVDDHVLSTPLESNIPCLMALLGIW